MDLMRFFYLKKRDSAGVVLPSLVPLLQGRTIARHALFWHYPMEGGDSPHFLGGRSSGSVRQNNWKLIEFFDDQHLELYNLTDDPGEQHNLAAGNPAKRNELHGLIRKWREEGGG